jgi:hypothetical protein
MSTPDSPAKICGSTSPCKCEWYQYVPGSISVGSFQTTWLKVSLFMTRKTLSEMPIGDINIPWPCKLVGCPSPFVRSIRTVSPGLTRSVGPM